jgi:hypothetical protein
MINRWFGHSLRRSVALMALLTLTACGGGGGGDDGGGFLGPGTQNPDDFYTLEAKLVDQEGTTITTVDPLKQGYVLVRVLDDRNEPAVQEVVSAVATLGTLLPSSGTALTNSDGVATFILLPAETDGAGTVTASISTDAGEATTTVNYQLSTDLPYTFNVNLVDENGEPLDNVETTQNIGLLIDVIDDRDGSAVPFTIVNVALGSFGSVIPDSGSVLSDENGRARFDVTTGDTTGAFELTVSATLAGGEVIETFAVNVDQAIRKIGHFDDSGEFIEGVIKVEPAKELSPGGTAALTVAVVDGENQRTSSEEVIEITSECLFGGEATLNPGSPVTFTSQTTVSYTVNGCSGSDAITARLGSTGATATNQVEISEITAESISFTSANPEIIAIRDTGNSSSLTESSAVSFTVSDRDGNPVSDARVNFELSTGIGGVALNCISDPFCSYSSVEDQIQGRSRTATDRSNLDGVAVAELLSGFVATPVRVLAYIDLDEDGVRDDAEPATTSGALVITTGLPDQDSISLSAGPLNVLGAFDTDGTTSTLTVRMADKYNNPVPDGTQAVFTTEYGSIEGSCTTTAGRCSVTWSSQAPRSSAYAEAIRIFDDPRYDCPSHNEPGGPCPDDIADPAVNPPGAPRGGRTTILVTAIGEESFVDANANGLYDEGEFWTNLPEAFRDENEDGIHTPSQRANCSNPATADDICLAGFDEDFVDFNQNGVYDLNNTPAAAAGSSLPSGLYNGVLCRQSDDDIGVCSRDLLNVRDSIVVINSFSSGSSFDLLVIEADEGNEPDGNDPLDDGEIYVLYVSDIFNNPPPAGTEISYEGSGRCDVLTPSPTIGDTNRPGAFGVSFAVSTADGEAPTADPDQVTIIMTLSNGATSVATYPCRVEDPEPDTGTDGGDGPDFSPSGG